MRDLVDRFGIDETAGEASDHHPRYNVAPTQQALVIASSGDESKRLLGTMRWGLVPRWAKDPSIGNRMINARSEKVTTSNAYRSAFARRRCIIPVDGFYEWAPPGRAALTADASTPPESAKPVKTPFHIHAPDRAPLALAGLWESWSTDDGPPLRTFTILTRQASPAMERIHDRMPVILAPADWSRWLTATPLDEPERERMFEPPPADHLAFDRVSTAVNRPVNDSPDLIVPV